MTFVTVLVWILIVSVPLWAILLLGEFADADLPWRRRRPRGPDADPEPSGPDGQGPERKPQR